MSEFSEQSWWRENAGCAARIAAAALAPRPFALPGDKPHWARDRVIDVKHIRIDVSFDINARTVIGRCATTFSPINDGVQRVEFDAVEMTINRVQRADGVEIPFDYGDDKLTLRLPAPL